MPHYIVCSLRHIQLSTSDFSSVCLRCLPPGLASVSPARAHEPIDFYMPFVFASIAFRVLATAAAAAACLACDDYLRGIVYGPVHRVLDRNIRLDI